MFNQTLAATLLFLSWVNLFSGCLAVGDRATEPEDSGWHNLETRHTVIYYQRIEDLKQFDRRISYPTGKWPVISNLFGATSDALQDKVKKKVDGIFEKAQHLLGMHKQMDKVRIHVCRNRKQLDENYHRIYGKPCRFRAWYVYKLNAVYVNHRDLDEGMLSHELAHSLIDHYLLVRPPRATAEILSKYVDRHLFD